MTTTAKTLKRAYFDWLLQEYTYTDIEKNVIEIGTPFLDNDFDYITMYAVISQTGQITLTDDGWTLNNLKSHGVTFDGRSKHKQKLLHEITASLGIEVSDDHELMIRTDLDKFPLAKQRLLQSIMQVNDLIVLRDNSVKSIFFEEVESFLRSQEILYAKRPSFAGKEGITVQFDFSIPTIHEGEKLIRTISNGNDLNRAKLLTMDTQLLKNYKDEARFIAIIDDVTKDFNKKSETEAIFKENSDTNIILLPKSELTNQKQLLLNRA
ncbi:TPA: DUF1828 domain-containing protein [Streptococcus suis]